MKNDISILNINKIFESKVRLSIISVLMGSETIDFNELKNMLKLTDGNLASHISTLEKNGFIKSKKKIIGKKTNTSFVITEKGKKEFKMYLDELEQYFMNKTEF